MHVADTIFIFCLALIIFGPKKLPEIGRQIGKLMVEFRRASNEFKMQIEDELRASEEAERQKEINAAKTMLPTPIPAANYSAALAAETATGEASASSTAPEVLPPSTGLPVNHTFNETEKCSFEATLEPASPEPASEDANPKSDHSFNPALNTASNGAISEVPAEVNFPAETFEPATAKVEAPEPEKAPEPAHHG